MPAQPSPGSQAGAAAASGPVAGQLEVRTAGAGAQARPMRATADAVCAAGTAGEGFAESSSGMSSLAGVRGQLQGYGSRRTTWEGAAFTAKEQGRLEAVRAALQAERQQVSSTPNNCGCNPTGTQLTASQKVNF